MKKKNQKKYTRDFEKLNKRAADIQNSNNSINKVARRKQQWRPEQGKSHRKISFTGKFNHSKFN